MVSYLHFTLSLSAEKEHFAPAALNFGLWPQPTNLTQVKVNHHAKFDSYWKNTHIQQTNC